MPFTVVVRFPSGDTEYRLTDTPPKAGDEVTRNGQKWVVRAVSQAADGTIVVTLRAGADQPTA